MCENIYKAAFDSTEAGHYAVTQRVFLFTHAEVCTAVGDKHVEFFKRTLVQQLGDTLASGVFDFLVLFLDGFLTSDEACFRALVYKLLDFFNLFAHVVVI